MSLGRFGLAILQVLASAYQRTTLRKLHLAVRKSRAVWHNVAWGGSLWGRAMGFLVRFGMLIAASVVTAGCFQPLYGEYSATNGGTRIAQALSAVDVLQIDAPTGTDDARIAVELRNDRLFGLQGGSGGGSPTHSLKIKVIASRYVASQDLQTGLSSSNIDSITATYQLTDLRTGKVALNDKAYAPVSYDIPGDSSASPAREPCAIPKTVPRSWSQIISGDAWLHFRRRITAALGDPCSRFFSLNRDRRAADGPSTAGGCNDDPT